MVVVALAVLEYLSAGLADHLEDGSDHRGHVLLFWLLSAN